VKIWSIKQKLKVKPVVKLWMGFKYSCPLWRYYRITVAVAYGLFAMFSVENR